MRHAIVPDERLAAVLCHVSAVGHGTGEGRVRWHLLGQGVLEVLVAQVLVEGVLGREHDVTERALHLK